MKITFTTKDEYLAWTRQWKARYAEITTESREAKASRKLSSPTYSPYAQSLVHQLRYEARHMLEVRKEAKALSWQMKQALAQK